MVKEKGGGLSNGKARKTEGKLRETEEASAGKTKSRKRAS